MADFAEMRACIERALAHKPVPAQELIEVDLMSIEAAELERELEVISA